MARIEEDQRRLCPEGQERSGRRKSKRKLAAPSALTMADDDDSPLSPVTGIHWRDGGGDGPRSAVVTNMPSKYPWRWRLGPGDVPPLPHYYPLTPSTVACLYLWGRGGRKWQFRVVVVFVVIALD